MFGRILGGKMTADEALAALEARTPFRSEETRYTQVGIGEGGRLCRPPSVGPLLGESEPGPG